MKKQDSTKKIIGPAMICMGVTCFILLSMANVALAHRVVLFAWIQGDTIFTESLFPDGKKIAGGKIAVYDRDEALLISGKTDKTGKFSFKIPMQDCLKIVLDAGTGHRATWIFCEKDIQKACGADSNTRVVKFESPYKKQKALPETKPVDQSKASGENPAIEQTCPESQKIERIVEKALDKKLQPIMGMLIKLQYHGPTATDVFGGIGYIFGIMGIAAFFYSRKNKH